MHGVQEGRAFLLPRAAIISASWGSRKRNIVTTSTIHHHGRLHARTQASKQARLDHAPHQTAARSLQSVDAPLPCWGAGLASCWTHAGLSLTQG